MKAFNEFFIENVFFPLAMITYTVFMVQLVCSVYQDWRKAKSKADEAKDTTANS